MVSDPGSPTSLIKGKCAGPWGAEHHAAAVIYEEETGYKSNHFVLSSSFSAAKDERARRIRDNGSAFSSTSLIEIGFRLEQCSRAL